jgi:hypothetical protein
MNDLWTVERFYAAEDETNVIWMDEGSLEIKAATLPLLIAKLTLLNSNFFRLLFLTLPDPVFLNEFLTTYRSCIPGGGCELFRALRARDKTATEDDSRVIRLR